LEVEEMIRKDKRPASSALFGVAAIAALGDSLKWLVWGPWFRPFDWVITFSFVLFTALAILARWRPISGTVIAALWYAAILVFEASDGIRVLLSGLVFKIPIVVFLLLALVLALTSRKSPPQAGQPPHMNGFADSTGRGEGPPMCPGISETVSQND
jgi:hypothetical protein